MSGAKTTEQVVDIAKQVKQTIEMQFSEKIDEPDVKHFLAYCAIIIKERHINSPVSFERYLNQMEQILNSGN